jgi:hypothetical protein
MRLRSIRDALAAALVVLVAGCGPTIRSSVSGNVNLSQYRTYAFRTPTYRQGHPETLAEQTIESTLRQDLAMRGLTEASANPDFFVSFHVKTQQRLSTTSVGYGFWGYGYGPATVTEYTQGTLIVDFIDARTMQVFWRGTATDVVNHPATPNLAKVEKAVSEIVNRYPAQMAAAPRTTM